MRVASAKAKEKGLAKRWQDTRCKSPASENDLQYLRAVLPRAAEFMAQDLNLSDAARLAQRTRAWQAAVNEIRFPKRDREGEEGLLAKLWSDMVRLHREELSAAAHSCSATCQALIGTSSPSATQASTRGS